ncbi:MAG: putative ribosome quality control (RQC) complex YloA/Tae2 family protein [Pseudohongiellaceae bacterium]|jgi:predicted ribosome quality control (RQC) complex YloA/Tae2 family protein
MAQSPADNKTLKAELESANTALSDLDAKALNCTNSFNMNLGEAAALLCDEFIRAIDGDLLASYIDHCNTLKIWRDDFILDTQNSSANLETSKESSERSSAENLALMVGVEYSCGENALKERTVHVVSAFNTLSERTLLNKSPQLSIQQSLDRRLADLAQQSRLKSQGQSLQNSIQQQGQRQQEATQQQNQRLETQLIRQQINNPP